MPCPGRLSSPRVSPQTHLSLEDVCEAPVEIMGGCERSGLVACYTGGDVRGVRIDKGFDQFRSAGGGLRISAKNVGVQEDENEPREP